MNKVIGSSSGQASVEASLAIFLLATATVAMMAMFYFIYSSFWIDHILSEANICVAEGTTTWQCEKEAKSNLSKNIFLPEHFLNLHIRKNSRQIHSYLKIDLKKNSHSQKNFKAR